VKISIILCMLFVACREAPTSVPVTPPTPQGTRRGPPPDRVHAPSAAPASRPPAAPASRPSAALVSDATGTDFGTEARLLHRWVACGSGAAQTPPPGFSPRLVRDHCERMQSIMAQHRRRFVAPATPFFARLRPSGLSTRVIYPFGGGDLLFPLTLFPEAREITTISLERAGSPHVADLMRSGLKDGRLRHLLNDAHWMFMRLAAVDYNFTTHMTHMERRLLPMQLTLALCALAVHGYEPVSLRYFRLRPDGSLQYLNRAELEADERQHLRKGAEALAAAERDPATGKRRPARERRQRLKQARLLADGIPLLFSNLELTYRRPGEAPRVYRHMDFNLDNAHLAADPSPLAHLTHKGRVAAMTKAASYLLWMDDFSSIRDYLLQHMDWMVSDSTGILPEHARAAGFRQEVFGSFKSAILLTRPEHQEQMALLFRRQKKRELPFRFGYPDRRDHSAHLVITTRP